MLDNTRKLLKPISEVPRWHQKLSSSKKYGAFDAGLSCKLKPDRHCINIPYCAATVPKRDSTAIAKSNAAVPVRYTRSKHQRDSNAGFALVSRDQSSHKRLPQCSYRPLR